MKKNSAFQLESNHTRVACIWVVEDWIILKVWQIITLHSFDLQRLTVPFWKDLDHAVNIASAQKTASILKIGFVLSKWIHLHKIHLENVWNHNFIAIPLAFVLVPDFDENQNVKFLWPWELTYEIRKELKTKYFWGTFYFFWKLILILLMFNKTKTI